MFDSHRLESRVSMDCCHCMDQLLCSEYHGPNGSKPSFLLIKFYTGTRRGQACERQRWEANSWRRFCTNRNGIHDGADTAPRRRSERQPKRFREIDNEGTFRVHERADELMKSA
jgi:hypothetical protein